MKLTILVAALTTVVWGTPLQNLISPDLEGRIIGGDDTTIEEYPFMAAVLRNGKRECGGSIISTTWILTAAHCITSNITAQSVRVGSTIHSSGGEVIPAARTIIYEDYPTEGDIALIELESPITHPIARIAVLATEEDVPAAGTTATVIGWGTTRTEITTDILQVVQVPVISLPGCDGAYRGSLTDSRLICTAVEGRGPCFGDSGGPLIANGLVTGLVYGGAQCASGVHPSLYTSVPTYRAWIKQNSGV